LKDEIVAVVGLGYVGLPLALQCNAKGYKVIGIDVDGYKIDLLRRKLSPFHDEKIVRELASTSVEFEQDPSRIREAGIVIICVPTPVYEDHTPNLEPLIGAANSVAPYLRRGTLVVVESTINPGVSESIVLPA